MAITPQAGYQVDPNNPNGVIPIGTGAPTNSIVPTAPQGNAVIPTVPAASAPSSPATQPSTPPASTTVNVNTSPTTQPAEQTAAKPSVVMPANGSVVDLLNSAGQDSSFAARQQLAQQFGIQGYTGTAQQNQDLSKKYVDAYNANKGKDAPTSGAQASSALDSYFKDQSATDVTQDPTKAFMDMYAGMNPIEANIFHQLSGLLSQTTNQQSLKDLYTQEASSQGIPELNMQLADINKIMNGTEDDIRNEIGNVGGFATESQVQALTGARNKNLLKQASYLTDVLNARNDYVDRIVSLTQADRDQVGKDLDRKLGITNTLVTMSTNMQNAAKENYQRVIDSVGWEGLAKSVAGNPTQTKKIEQTLGLAPGELAALGQYKKPLNEMEQAQLQGQLLQNQKTKQDLSKGPALDTQVVDLGGKKVLINSKTGAVISDISSNFAPDKTVQLAGAQQSIADTTNLLTSPGLAGTVGPNMLARSAPDFNFFTGVRSNFIAGVEQLRGQMTLESLQNAKANGATFGALSDSELGLLSSSASKLGSWAIKDKAGNVTGYNASETDFKKELDKINYFSKLDFVLKGGSPNSVGAQQMADGSFWVKNSDGTLSKLQ